jgi:acyl-CoA reductase-like NAD-dependent aldehyde dehydrogenase
VRKKLFINGKWLETDQYTQLFAPYSHNLLAEIPIATEKEIEQAIESAYMAKDSFRRTPSHYRANILEKVANLLQENADQAAKIIAEEAAKPLKYAKAEVERTIQTYKFSAEEAKRIHGETIPLDAAPGGEGRLAYTLREPLGVIGAITPFNFPFNLVAHKVGPAIASGNTIVLKPASQTPLSALFLAELFEQAGLPPGVLNVITGSGAIVGDKLVTDPRISAITFTGSPDVGIQIRNKAGLKRVTLELGSNSALIIDQSASIDEIIDRCVASAFSYQGQICISLQRIFVHEQVYEEFLQKFIDATKQLKLGCPLNIDTDLTSLISPKEAKRIEAWLKEATEQGARIVTGGYVEGNIFHPTVVTEVAQHLKLSCQEAFGPIVVINKFKNIDDAFERVNDSNYGLQVGIYTENIHTALLATEILHVGGVMINDTPTFRVDHMPYGGVKESGMGREGIKYAIEELTELKLVVIKKK